MARPTPEAAADTRFTHLSVDVGRGVSLHVAEATRASVCGALPARLPSDRLLSAGGNGDLPAVVMVHGWPELWYSWREQAAGLAAVGVRVLVPDMRGYGGSSKPEEVEAYAIEHLCGDLIGLLDALDLKQAVFIGHDWGGAVVWAMAQHHPGRVAAVAGVNTPLRPRAPMDPIELMNMQPGVWDYQLWFQDVGVAEKHFEEDLHRTFTALFQGAEGGKKLGISTRGVRKRGGMLAGLPKKLPKSVLSDDEMAVYVAEYKRGGFRGPLNWYRNLSRNWVWDGELPEGGEVVTQPALMVTAGEDAVLAPKLSRGMEKLAPRLERAHIGACAHFTQSERPVELTAILLAWLLRTFSAPRSRL